jgi:hypothetical protein
VDPAGDCPAGRAEQDSQRSWSKYCRRKQKGVWTRGFSLLGTYLFGLVGREQKLRIGSAAPSQVA